MMSNKTQESAFIIDIHALSEIIEAQYNNIIPILKEMLEGGEIAMPSCVWRLFGELYEDKKALLEASVTNKISTTKEFQIGAANIADKLNSKLSWGPYDDNSELYTAAMAKAKNCTVLTVSKKCPFYEEAGCEAVDIFDVL